MPPVSKETVFVKHCCLKSPLSYYSEWHYNDFVNICGAMEADAQPYRLWHRPGYMRMPLLSPCNQHLAAGDKAHNVSVRLQLAFFQGTSGQQHCEHLGQPTNGPSFITQLTHTTPLNTSSSYTHLLV